MELTKEQVGKVQYFLETKKFDYLDLKIEVLDHMVSEIEMLMDKNITFNKAFKMVTLKWQDDFKMTSSLYFGIQYSESKIVIKKAIKQFRLYFLLYVVSYFLPLIPLKLSDITFSESFVSFANGFLMSFILCMIVYVLYIFIKVKKSKVKTTASFVLRTQYFGLIFLVISLLVGVFDKNGSLNPVMTGFTFAGFAVVFICNRFYKKHLAVISKFKSVEHGIE